MNRILIVEDLLLLARREEPDFLALETVDVGALTDALLAKAAALAHRDWVLDVRGQGVIVSDRQRLTQAMMQLAQNAVQHTEAGDRIALGSSIRDGTVRLVVKDDRMRVTTER